MFQIVLDMLMMPNFKNILSNKFIVQFIVRIECLLNSVLLRLSLLVFVFWSLLECILSAFFSGIVYKINGILEGF